MELPRLVGAGSRMTTNTRCRTRNIGMVMGLDELICVYRDYSRVVRFVPPLGVFFNQKRISGMLQLQLAAVLMSWLAQISSEAARSTFLSVHVTCDR